MNVWRRMVSEIHQDAAIGETLQGRHEKQYRATIALERRLKRGAGATSPNPQVVVRMFAPQVEAAMGLLRAIRVAWREEIWQLGAAAMRI